jgi:hypothetical protein
MILRIRFIGPLQRNQGFSPIRKRRSSYRARKKSPYGKLSTYASIPTRQRQQAMEKSSFCVKQIRKDSVKDDEASKSGKLPLDKASSSDVSAPKDFVSQTQRLATSFSHVNGNGCLKFVNAPDARCSQGHKCDASMHRKGSPRNW